MDSFMQPSTCYIEPVVEEEDISSNEEEATQKNTEATKNLIPETQPIGNQYFVNVQSGSDQASNGSTESDGEVTETGTQRKLFPLPQVECLPRRQTQRIEPLVDYSKSIIMTLEDYISAMTAKAERKESVAREREEKKTQAEQRRIQREEEKACKEADKLLKRIQMERKKAKREREKIRKVAERARIKFLNPPGRKHGSGLAGMEAQ